MKIVIVGHHARKAQAERLALRMHARLILDDQDRGALWGHQMALSWAAMQDERVVIMEDDAEPVADFRDLARKCLGRFQFELVSFYLGTGRPKQWQTVIGSEIKAADGRGQDYIKLRQLIHGVCYSIPSINVCDVLTRMGGSQAADYAIGTAWRKVSGRDVVYTLPSLVDHADGPSVERHPDREPRTERRKAWRLYEHVS